MPKKRARKARTPRKKPTSPKRDAPARPRIIDLRDYSSVGRPTKYVPEFARVAAKMAEAGATDLEIAHALGVTVRSLYRWKAEIPEFCHAIAGAKQIPDSRVERSLYHRAVGYEHEHDEIIVIKGRVTSVKTLKHYPPETAAARMWLHNRLPGIWRPRTEPEPPPPSEANASPIEELTDEEIDARLARIEANRQARAGKALPTKKRARK